MHRTAPTFASAEPLFAALASAIAASPGYSHLHLPGAAAPLCGHYDAAWIRQLVDQVPEVREYGVVDGVERSSVVARSDVFARVRQGCTMTSNGVHLADALSAQWAGRLHQLLAAPGKPIARFFFSNALERAYPLHLDPFHTLTLQISGAKKWRIARRREPLDPTRLTHSVLAPPPGVAEDYPCGRIVGPGRAAEAFDEVLLQPGDALLLAPGVWHHVLPVVESFSVALDVVPVDRRGDALEVVLIRHPA